jgi:ligand-binding sensor domain-containing protein/signal transduction histidine kinase
VFAHRFTFNHFFCIVGFESERILGLGSFVGNFGNFRERVCHGSVLNESHVCRNSKNEICGDLIFKDLFFWSGNYDRFINTAMNALRRKAMAALVAAGLAALAQHGYAAPSMPVPSLVVANNADGRLEVFHVDEKGELRHRWQRESTHDWSAWSSLGGVFSPGVAAARDDTGRLVVFAVERNSKTLEYNRQKEPDSPAWSSWMKLSGEKVEAPVAVGTGSSGMLEVFAVEAEHHSVKHIWQTGELGDWTEWSDMGAALRPGLRVVRDRAGQLELFGIAESDGRLMHGWQTLAAEPGDWSEWFSLGISVSPGFAVAENSDGRLEIFGVNTQGAVMHAFQQVPKADSPWSRWTSLGGKMKPEITVGRNRDGRLEIFTVDPRNDMIYHAFQSHGGSTNWVSWTDMSLVGGIPGERNVNLTANEARLTDMGAVTQSYPAIGSNVEGRVEIFAFDERRDDVLYHRSQIVGNLNWTDWSSLDHTTAQYLTKAWRTGDGLPDNRVQAIVQTPDGYIWVGTHNGLAKFDGVHFEPVDLGQTPPFAHASVTCLLVDREGALWIGSEGGGLAEVYHGQVRHYQQADGLASDSVTAVCEDTSGSLWIGTTAGLSRYKDEKFTNYTRNDGLSAGGVHSILEDSSSNLWVATDHGLTRIKGRSVREVPQSDGLPGNLIRSLWQDIPGRLWIGSDRGLVLYRGSRFFAYDQTFGLSDKLVSAVYGDRQGNLWVGTYSGLTRFENGKFDEDFQNEGISLGKINALFEDREGDLWAGSQNGLFRLAPNRLLFYDKRQGLTQNNITSVIEDDAGTLWAGTAGGWLDQLTDKSFAAYAPSNDFPLKWITSLCKGSRGGLWVGGDYGGGIVEIKDNKITRFPFKDSLAGANVTVMHKDRSGILWFGTGRGLGQLSDGKFSTYTVSDGLAGNSVRDICEDTQGNLWIATDGGISLCKGGHFTNYTAKDGLSDNHITALYPELDHSLWVGTENGGLNHFRNGHFKAYNTNEGLFSNEILAIVEDDFGWLWMSCSTGVFRVSKTELAAFDARLSRTFTSIAYGHDDGMGSVLCSASKPGGWKTRDGEVWFATSLGLVAIDPRAMGINDVPPPVYIEQMIAGRTPLLHPNDSFSTDSPVTRLDIPPGRNDLEFHYTALDFQRPERIRFRYQLAGVDPTWIEAGTRRTAYYNNLPPGPYSFHVIACNSDGVWNETGAVLGINVLPHFWQTWLFLGLCALAAASSIGGVARYATKRKLQRELQQMQQQHAVELERTRIARDMHDELGAKLTSISFQGAMAQRRLENSADAGQHIEKMASTARELVCSLDEIVWAVDPKNDSLDDLATYVCRYASAFFEDSPIYCKFVIPPRLPDFRLTTDVRHNLFLAVKEALNNVLKHSEATRAEIQIAVRADTFEICILDNGRGMAKEGHKSGRVGHGLANLHERLEAIQGYCKVITAPGEGTAIHFVVPLTPALSSNYPMT